MREKLGTGKFRKFAYLPTPDHKYILELGLRGTTFDELNRDLDDQKSIQRIVSVDPYVESFEIYNSMGRTSDTNVLPEKSLQGYVDEVIGQRKNLEISDPQNARTIRYIFVDLHVDGYGSDPSRIIEITYNTQSIQDSLNRLLLFHLIIGILAIAIGIAMAVFLTGHITRPIKKIVEDVNIIASGDLEHRIGKTQSSEFAVLENSTNKMVDSLKRALQQVKDGEILQKEIVDQLPVAMFMKSRSDGKYLFWNKASEQIFDLPASEVIGRTDKEIFSESVVSVIQAEDQEACQNKVFIKNKKIVSKSRGQRIIHMIIVPISDSTNTVRYILRIAEDLTEETLNMKIDLLFSITRRDILDQLLVIINYLERAPAENFQGSNSDVFQ